MRIALPVLCLALGAGATVGFTRYLLPPAVVTVAEPAPPAPPVSTPAAPPSDELVVEIRVRVPPGGAPVFQTDGSDTRQGSLVNTQQPFDLAIEGAGFFRITLPNGEYAYTRVGNFGRGSDGALVTVQGFRLTPEIKVPDGVVSASVGTDGTVSVQRAGALNASTNLGQLALVRFPNPGWMTPKENGLFVENERSGIPTIAAPGQDGMGLIRQGFRERQPDRRAALVELIRELGREGQVEVKTGKE